MVLDTFSFRFNQIIADVEIPEEVVNEIFNLCTKHKLCIFTDDLINNFKEQFLSSMDKAA